MFRKLSLSLAACAVLSIAGALLPQGFAHAQDVSATASSAADATPQQIYDMARAGDSGRAQQMIDQVLRDHPNSAKAHYVAAEVFARSGDLSRGRRELSEAQSLSPGLAFATPRAVQELQQQLSGRRVLYGTPLVRQSRGISWGAILLLVGVGAVIFALLRRRSVAAPYGQAYGARPYGGGYGQPYPPTNPYGPYPGGPAPYGVGGGSGLMGGLATGLAVGAGVAAGEALTQRMLGGGSVVPGEVVPSADAGELPLNADMGGNDFGINDGSSWDGGGGGDPFGGDIGGGDMGGGGDWT